MSPQGLESWLEYKSKEGGERWASLYDLLEVDRTLLELAEKWAAEFSPGQANLGFSMSSSTSGMYAAWEVRITMDSTVYLQMRLPTGRGHSLNAALARFVQAAMKNAPKLGTKEGESNERVDVQA